MAILWLNKSFFRFKIYRILQIICTIVSIFPVLFGAGIALLCTKDFEGWAENGPGIDVGGFMAFFGLLSLGLSVWALIEYKRKITNALKKVWIYKESYQFWKILVGNSKIVRFFKRHKVSFDSRLFLILDIFKHGRREKYNLKFCAVFIPETVWNEPTGLDSVTGGCGAKTIPG